LRSFSAQPGQVRNKAFDLLAGGFAEGLGTAEINRVGLDEVGIELVLADLLTGRGGRGPWDRRSFRFSH